MKDDTVEVLVRIPKKEFEELQSNYVWWGKHGEYIKKGTVLPKGHGRLVDADAITKHVEIFKQSFVINYDKLTGKSSIACTVPSVIEADKEEEHDSKD